jgi:anti-sigma regulatory factor (Ser/Thr protein kinase)
MLGTTGTGEALAVSTRIAGGVDASCTAREIVTRLVGDTTPAETLHDALLLTSELVTNAVVHAGVGDTEALDLYVATWPDYLHVSVCDPGGVESSPQVQQMDVTVPGGMGLFLVDQISSRWGVDELRSGGTQVWFELAR